MNAEKKEINVKDGKVVGDNVKDGTKMFNMSIGFQDKVRVEFTRGRYAGTVADVPELKAKRLFATKKAKHAKDKDLITVYHATKKTEQSEDKE